MRKHLQLGDNIPLWLDVDQLLTTGSLQQIPGNEISSECQKKKKKKKKKKKNKKT
jgi:hypothetical protein